MRSEYWQTDPDDPSSPQSSPDSMVGEGPPSDQAGGGASWRVFLAMGIASGFFFWLFWSFGMSMLLRRDVIGILTGAGAGGGLFFGAFFGGFMAILMRPATVTFPVGDRGDFLSRLDAEMAKLRYRPLSRAKGLRVYGPRTLFRPRAFNIIIRVGDAEATVIGPRANITALRKRFRV